MAGAAAGLHWPICQPAPLARTRRTEHALAFPHHSPAGPDLSSHSMASPSRITTLVRKLGKRGSRSEQRQAASTLADLTAASPASRSTAAAAGAIPALVRLLEAEIGCEQVAEHAVAALGNIAIGSPAHQAAAVAAGAAPLLVQLLTERHSSLFLAVVASAARNLANESTALEFLQAGAIPALVQALSIGSSVDASSGDSGGSTALQWTVLEALHNIASRVEHSQPAVAAGAVQVAVDSLASSSAEVKGAAAALLGRLCGADAGAEAAAAAGAAQRLVQLLSTATSNSKSESRVALALVNLTHVQAGADAAVAAGGVPALVGLLRCSLGRQQVRTVESATLALVNLVRKQHSAAFAAAGSLPAVASLLSRPCGSRCQVAAAEILQYVAADHPQLIDASTGAAATAGLVPLATSCTENGQEEGTVLSAVIGLWFSSAENQPAIGAALARLQRSSDRRVQQSAKSLAAFLTVSDASHSGDATDARYCM